MEMFFEMLAWIGAFVLMILGAIFMEVIAVVFLEPIMNFIGEVIRGAVTFALEPFARGLRSGSGVPTLGGIWAAACACIVGPLYHGGGDDGLSVLVMILMGVAAILALTATVYWLEAGSELPVPLPSDVRPGTRRTWSHHYSGGRWPVRGQ
ncbi:MAG TPA: hypothetical protein VE913_06420 [Longimicrobium sp.]|nr:hypothetical protein [Longimicrobium sp.]